MGHEGGEKGAHQKDGGDLPKRRPFERELAHFPKMARPQKRRRHQSDIEKVWIQRKQKERPVEKVENIFFGTKRAHHERIPHSRFPIF